uniref:CASP-like protein n=1 Tax=Cannabis sativa TaxID=3483 RepID=A0A803P1T9_CANSA
MASTDQESGTPAVNNNISYEPVGKAQKLVLMSTVTRIVCLGLWLFIVILLFIALIVLATNSKTIEDIPITLNVQNVSAYSYMLSVIVFGLVYSLWRLGFSIYLFITNVKGYFLIDFYGDKIISYLLATGTAAGFAATKDVKTYFSQQFQFLDLEDGELDGFCSMGYASASLVLIAFICTAMLSVMSSYAFAANAKPRA